MWQKLAGFKATKQAKKAATNESAAASEIPNAANRDQNATRSNNDIINEHQLQLMDVQDAYNNNNDIELQVDMPEVPVLIHPPPYPEGQEVHVPRTTRSGRVSNYPKRYEDYIAFSANTTES